MAEGSEAEKREEGVEATATTKGHPYWFMIVRDAVLVLFGLGMLFNEAIIRDDPRETLIITAMGMLGAPGFTIAKQLLGKG